MVKIINDQTFSVRHPSPPQPPDRAEQRDRDVHRQDHEQLLRLLRGRRRECSQRQGEDRQPAQELWHQRHGNGHVSNHGLYENHVQNGLGKQCLKLKSK